jgi:uncharacterized protein DUF1579
MVHMYTIARVAAVNWGGSVVGACGRRAVAKSEEASMKSLRIVLVVLAMVGLAGFAGGQDKPTPEKAYLEHFVGNWDATVKMMGNESKATETCRLEAGMWLISDFKGEFGGQKFVGHDVMGFDTSKKKFTGVWVDSMGPSLTPYEGTLDASGKVLTAIMDASGQKMKNVTKIVDKDTTTFEMYNPETAKEPMMTITYKRKK